MLTVCIGAVANIALDPLFIYVFDMGVAGAALATVLSQALSAAFTVFFLLGRSADVKLSFGGYDGKTMGRILTLGLSPFLIIATDSAMLLALNGVLRAYGGSRADDLISAATIMLSFCKSSPCPSADFGGTQPALSYNYGATTPPASKDANGRFWVCASRTRRSCSWWRGSGRAAWSPSLPRTPPSKRKACALSTSIR